MNLERAIYRCETTGKKTQIFTPDTRSKILKNKKI
ncbi:Protein CBG25249 [Caenorhabditis briggsae]|uniref:Protein CBG25249 n=1 Tax=Caenorhabditis briggsae TaxID=6238 RepID=B6IFL9_CAEBR|nr:Protein CBG25249 [Caenorhabditis briggsae]CAR98699.1 Protein CBG25249 [Caenorhabditis briggsae]